MVNIFIFINYFNIIVTIWREKKHIYVYVSGFPKDTLTNRLQKVSMLLHRDYVEKNHMQEIVIIISLGKVELLQVYNSSVKRGNYLNSWFMNKNTTQNSG
jgi:hypothetical protein